jgi:hypothetical protein
MTRKRRIREQIRSGLRIAGLILLSFAVFVGLAGGFVFLTQMKGWKQLLGVSLVLILNIFLFVTARYWAKWLLCFFAYACLRLFGGILFGPYSSHPVTRQTVTIWFLYALAGTGLTLRYLRRPPHSLERFGLTFFVSCVALALAVGSSTPLVVGLAVLATCEGVQLIISQTKDRAVHMLRSRIPSQD